MRVGGTGVTVGETGVLVRGGLVAVCVLVGGFVGVPVGKIGVRVGVFVGDLVGVFVTGCGVFVASSEVPVGVKGVFDGGGVFDGVFEVLVGVVVPV